MQCGTDFGDRVWFSHNSLVEFPKSDIVRTVWSFFGMMKKGKAHLDDGCHFNNPIDIRRLISFIRVALCIFGIGYGLPWYGLAPSFNSKETGSNFQSPSMPSKSSLNLRSNTSSKLRCDVLRCTHFFLQCLEGLLCHT